jgi:hypothetical protein
MFYVEHVEPLRQFLLAYVTERQRAGVFRSCNAPAVVRSILALPTYHVLVTRLLGSSAWSVDDDAAIGTFTDVVLHGLRTPRTPRQGRALTRTGAHSDRRKGQR